MMKKVGKAIKIIKKIACKITGCEYRKIVVCVDTVRDQKFEDI